MQFPAISYHCNGFFSVLLTNTCMVAGNYLIQCRNFSFPEVGLTRGIIQVVVFGPLVLLTQLKACKEKEKPERSKLSVLFVIAYGILLGSASAAVTAAILMMPMSRDFY